MHANLTRRSVIQWTSAAFALPASTYQSSNQESGRMPFTPKFADLVRNVTTVQGTGPVTLGAAVSGCTGFAEALGAGDQFYYCIQGVDKPQEREVGRGTMQADGKIARQPIAGSPTNFTNGAKTIALVAPAEWFARLEQMGGGAITSAATREELAAVNAAQAPRAYLAEAGRAGSFVFDAANLSAKVSADSRQGLYVAPASDPSGASGAWVRKFDGPVNVRWFGTAGDNATNDGPAFAAAIACLKSHATGGFGYGKGSGELFVPAGVYFLGTTTLDLTHTLTIEGEGGPGDAGGGASILRWAANASGIRVQTHNTSGATAVRTSQPLDRGDGSVIRGLHLRGAYSSTEGEFHGIHLRGRATIRDCYISGFQGDGVHVVASAGSGAPTEGNANNFEITKLWVDNCRHGVYVDGADANAGCIVAANSNYNRRWGIWDSSFLGNTYVACHTSENGDGAYKTDDPSARNVLIGCYSEGGQPASSFAAPTLLLGGLHGAGTGGYAGHLDVNFNQALKAPAAFEVGSTLGVGSNASIGGTLTVAGATFANGNLTVSGALNVGSANTAFGPQSGPASDSNFYFENTNYNSFLNFRSWSGGAPQVDGYVRSFRGWGLMISGSNVVRLQVNGADVVDVSASGIGYASGQGGAVTQSPSKTTGVILNKCCGQIIMHNAALAAGASASFTVSNNKIAASDVVIVNIGSGATSDAYVVTVTSVATGSCRIQVRNVSAGSLSEGPVLNFALLKAVAT